MPFLLQFLIVNLVPRFILEKFAAGEVHGRLPAIVLYVDISGFTPLTAALFAHHQDGAELLSETLAQIFHPLVNAIYAWGGFISHFSGDALTAVFPTTPDSHQAAYAASQTAVAVQAHLSPDGQPRLFATRYGEFAIGFKAGLAAGVLEWGIPGSQDKYTYYFRGDAIDDAVRVAAVPGVVVMHDFFLKLNSSDAAGSQHGSPAERPSLPPISHEQLRLFVADAILEMPLQADFRTICPVFLSFQPLPDIDTLHAFVGQVMGATAEYGGVFNRLEFGDKGGLMVLWFGAPFSHENNTERAARCLQALPARLPHLAGRWRAGLSEGLVWAGIRGAPARCEYTTFGDTVNIAAHIAMRAEWGEIWLDDTAVPALQSHFDLQPLGPQTLKNRTIPLYRLLSETASSPFFQGQMVGRQAELKQLNQAIAPIFNGQFAGLVGVHGEAGMGKSRLLYACQQQLSPPSLWLECQTDGILRHSLNPFRAMLRPYFQQTPARTPAENQAAFFHTLTELQQQLAVSPDPRATAVAAELQRTHSLLAALVDLYLPHSLYQQLEPKLRFENSLIALETFVQSQALIRPVVLHLVDVHWLDDDSQSFLNRLGRQLATYPVVILLSGRYREDGSLAAWWADTAVAQTHIHLAPLMGGDIEGLCCQLLPRPAAADVVAYLQQKGNGNPYFTEQLVLELWERQLLVEDEAGLLHLAREDIAAPPASLNALLITRLDRLPAPVKQIVQTASVLGQSFDIPVLTGIVAEPSALEAHLQQAVTRQILAFLDKQRLVFKHALLREAAYEMQPRTHLRQLHQRAATAVRHHYAADLAPHWGELAHHLETAFHMGLASVQVEACASLQEAGHFAARQYETAAAKDYYGRALVLTPPEAVIARSDLLLWQEEVVEWQGDRTTQQQLLDELDHLLPRLDVPRQTAVALRRARYTTLLPDYKQAQIHALHALDLALTTPDNLLQAQAYRRLGMILYRQQQYVAADHTLRSALELAQANSATDLVIKCLNNLGMALDEQGLFAAAQACYNRAIALQKQIHDLHGETITLNNLGWQNVIMGNTVAAQNYYTQALHLSRQIGHKVNEANGATNVGVMTFLHGDFAQAQHYYELALRLCWETGNRRGEANMYANLALLAVYQQDDKQAVAYGQTAVKMGQLWGGSGLIAEGYLALGHAYRQLGDFKMAAEAYQQTWQIWVASSRPFRSAEPIAGLAQIALEQERLDSALAYVEQILSYADTDEYAGIFERFWVDLVCYTVLRQTGDDRAAPVLAKTAHALWEKAHKIEDVGIREMFLQNFPAHQQIVALSGTDMK